MFGGLALTTILVSQEDDRGPILTDLATLPNPSPVNASFSLTAKASDLTTGGSRIVAATCGLGDATWGSLAASDGGFDEVEEDLVGEFTAPSVPGVYSLWIEARDSSGNVGERGATLMTVYDPSGGFVTGGGWIFSPAGAYPADPTLSGKATFGFVSSYRKGATVPTGNTEFQFHAASFDFKSTSYQWLVVAGAKAQYRGEGTINGAGTYGFMLTAVDGDLLGQGKPDVLRVKIWDKSTGAPVYDTQTGAADTADPTTILGGGSVVVHK